MRLAISILCVTLAGCSSLPALRERTSDKYRPVAAVPVLLYHHVHDIPAEATKALRRWSVTPKQLEEHMAWIEKQGFAVISMARLNQALKDGQPLPDKPIVLTFDDGWKDHYSVVFPLLEKYHYPGTFFITTDSVGHSAFMSWDELKIMAQSKFADIQSHSVTHPHLTRLNDEKAYAEILQSKKALEENLQKPVTVFAYPFGNYSEKTIAMAKAAGYESATIVDGSNIGYLLRSDRTYTLRRIAIEGHMTIEDVARSIENVKKQK